LSVASEIVGTEYLGIRAATLLPRQQIAATMTDMAAVLPDVLAPCLPVVFCGSAVGAKSREKQAYYAGPGNRFWPTLAEAGLTPRLLKPEEFKTVTKYGLGLTDLAKLASGNDDVLAGSDFDCNGLRQKILDCRPRVLAFVGKRSAKEFLDRKQVPYGLLPTSYNVGKTRLFVLPSPSGTARRYWSIEPWKELVGLLG
jgi:TDG/mug DNA glycosylase family protein